MLSFSASSLLLTPSSLPTLFGLQWNFDARPLLCYWKLNMPSPDLLSAATFILPTADMALKPSENTLFHEKHITQTSSAGSHRLAVFLLHFGSALIIFLLACLWPCSRGKSSYCQPKRERERAPSTFCIDLFLEDAVFICLFDQMSRNPGVQPCSSDITMAPLSCPVFPKLVTTVRFSVALWHAAIFVLRTCLGRTDFCSSSVFDWKWVTLYW